MEEERKIDEFYQIQAKKLVDSFFDLGLLSESLSRDGMIGIDGLVALWFQQIADNAAKVAGFTKKYKNVGEKERHEEEMRWIARAREAETRVAQLEATDIRSWDIEVGVFLKEVIKGGPAGAVDIANASRLFTQAVDAGFIPKPDYGPRKIVIPPGLETIRDLCSHSAAPYPGALIQTCPECGGNKI